METSRKEIIKKIAVIFFAVMLVLTFFSNTIMNYSLPEVATASVYSGSVSNKVRGQGVVEANADYGVTVSGARVIKEVMVEVGETVEAGQALFTFEEGENIELTEAEETLEQMELDYAKSLLKNLPDYASDDLDIKAAKEDLEAAVKAQDKAKTNAKDLKKAIAEENRAKEDVEAEQEKVETLQEQIDAYGGDADNEDANARVKALTEELSTANKTLKQMQNILEEKTAEVERLSAQPTLEEAQNAVKEKQKMLTRMQLALKERKEQDSLSQQADNLDMQAAQKKLEKQRQLVEKLKNSDDLKELKSKNAGVVSQIDFKEGDSITADVSLAKIQLADSGYIVNIQVTKAQANLLRTGDEATIENIWDDDSTATVRSIKADPENPNQNMIVSFEVQGDVFIGQNLSLSVGEKSNRYDAVVPNNAVREDSKGKFVLVVTVKGTPLGNRYKIKRAEVEVLASDDNYSGVYGGVYEGENVVTNSSKPLEEGMQVRLVE